MDPGDRVKIGDFEGVLLHVSAGLAHIMTDSGGIVAVAVDEGAASPPPQPEE